MLRSLILATAVFAAGPAFAAPPSWVIDPKQSAIAFTVTHAGHGHGGQFQTWSGDIRFDPADLPNSKAVINIDTKSAKMPDKQKDASLKAKEWFDVKAFPTARFATTAIRSLGGNKYEADGVVTMKGKDVPAKLAFTLAINGNVATMAGTATLDRLKLGLGLESDPKAEWVGQAVKVNVKVRATRAP